MPPSRDWTRGPAKWAAVVMLGCASLSGLAWSALTRAPRSAPTTAQPRPEPSRDMPPTPATQPFSPPPRDAGTAPPSAARRININTASSSQLQVLPGIGPALAGRIIEYRTRNGAFRSIDDLDNVKGI